MQHGLEHLKRLSELQDLKVVAGERVVEDFARVARHCTPLDPDERWMRGVAAIRSSLPVAFTPPSHQKSNPLPLKDGSFTHE
jgi:hypothetical protein